MTASFSMAAIRGKADQTEEYAMATAREPKKSESIEVRLSHEAKIAFAERCRRDRQTASEAIRLFIDGQIGARSPHKQSRMPQWRVILAAAAGAALGIGAAAPSLARATQPTPAAFDLLDRDHDGALSYEEFRRQR